MNCWICGSGVIIGTDSKFHPICQKCAEKPESSWTKFKRLEKPYRKEYLKATRKERNLIKQRKIEHKQELLILKQELKKIPQTVTYTEEYRKIYEMIYGRSIIWGPDLG